MRNLLLVAVAVLPVLVFYREAAGGEWGWEDLSRGNKSLRVVLVCVDTPGTIYAGSDREVLKSEDNGESWKVVLSLKGYNKAINFLSFHPQDKNILYAATGNGLFFSADQGNNWQRIFQGKNGAENECLCLGVFPDCIYLGTGAGLFKSTDNGRLWSKEGGKLGDSRIFSFAFVSAPSGYTYAAAEDGLFYTKDKGKSWSRSLIGRAQEANAQEAGKEENEESADYCGIKYIAIDPNDPNQLYLAASSGVYRSQDRGVNWLKLPESGLLKRDVNFLYVSRESKVYAVTKSAIFEYADSRWLELSFNLPAGQINFLTQDSQGNFYAAGEMGLFRVGLSNTQGLYFEKNLELVIKDEPEISRVQKAAVNYAEVQPEKIRQWRKLAAKKAWLPRLSLGMDRDQDKTVSSSIWGTYSSSGTPGRYFTGPDDVTRYDNRNWSVSLSWELGDLIWNSEQTSIDVRSKLMVELRGDIIDEVTKLYFERIRLKLELAGLPIEDRKKIFEHRLRLEELTALLDGLTGGVFSKETKLLKNSPEA